LTGIYRGGREMATEKQYQFFLYLFELENARETQLNDYGKNAISIAAAYSGFVLFVAEKMKDALANPVVEILFASVLAFMLAGLLLAIWGTRLAVFQTLSDPNSVIEQFTDTAMSDEEFFDNRIADCTAAIDWNVEVNDSKAKKLAFSSYSLAAGIFLHAAFFAVALLHPLKAVHSI
jgi:hypothetical protein